MAQKKEEVSAVKTKIKSIAIKAIPDNTLGPSRKYSNLVQVQNTAHDMTLLFCDIPPIYDMPEFIESGKIEKRIPIVSEIVIPFNLVPSLIKAIQQKYDEYQTVSKENKET